MPLTPEIGSVPSLSTVSDEEVAANRCGSYEIPKDKEKAGDEAAGKGADAKGRQYDFAKACSKLRDEMSDMGVTLSYGNYGFISKSNAEDLSNKGNPFYLENILYFGWGIGQVIIACSDNSAVAGAAQKYGITLKSGAMPWLAPTDVKFVEADKGSYTSTSGEKTEMSSDSQSDSSSSGQASLASVSYFFSEQFQSYEDDTLSYVLTGEKALANDEPLWKSVLNAVNSSLRSCASAPDGSFVAWYPDYWGMAGNTPYLELADIEMKDLTITQTDKEYYSHVFAPGVDVSGRTIEMYLTQAVVSIESDTSATVSEALFNATADSEVSDQVSALLERLIYIPEGEEWKYSPKELYRRYGARPTCEPCTSAKLIEVVNDETDNKENNEETESDEQNISGPRYILPFLYALYRFMYHWARQYQANLTMTFMPELFPGCRIKVQSLDIEFYVEKVTHNFSYESGFTTSATCTCPTGTLVSGMVNPS